MFSAETKQRADSRTLPYRRVPDYNVELISSLSSYIVDLRQPGASSLNFISVINCFRSLSLSDVHWPRSIHAFDNQIILIVRRLVLQQTCWPVFPQCGQYTEAYITAFSLAGLRCTVRNTGPIKSACSISLPGSFLFLSSTVEASYVAPNI